MKTILGIGLTAILGALIWLAMADPAGPVDPDRSGAAGQGSRGEPDTEQTERREASGETSASPQAPRIEAEPSDEELQGSESGPELMRMEARLRRPELTGNEDLDRRKLLRHQLRHSSLFDPDRPCPLTFERALTMPGANPEERPLEPKELRDLRTHVSAELASLEDAWSDRLSLEREALLEAVDAGSFDWHEQDLITGYDPTTGQSRATGGGEADDFVARMTRDYGEFGVAWHSVSVSSGGYSFRPYVTNRTHPELLRSMQRFGEATQRLRERIRNYIARLPPR